MAAGQLTGFCISVLMIALGVILCLYSVYDRRRTAEEQAKKVAGEVVRGLAEAKGITTSPISADGLAKIIEAILKIENPSLQVGVFLTVFGIVVMIISIFIPF